MPLPLEYSRLSIARRSIVPRFVLTVCGGGVSGVIAFCMLHYVGVKIGVALFAILPLFIPVPMYFAFAAILRAHDGKDHDGLAAVATVIGTLLTIFGLGFVYLPFHIALHGQF
jgi:cytochrome bd-type quinol oxidase subunit 2